MLGLVCGELREHSGLLLLKLGDTLPLRFQQGAVAGVAGIRQRRCRAAPLGVATAIQIDLRQQISLHGNTLVGGVHEDDLQPTINRLELQIIRTDKTYRQEHCMKQQ